LVEEYRNHLPDIEVITIVKVSIYTDHHFFRIGDSWRGGKPDWRIAV